MMKAVTVFALIAASTSALAGAPMKFRFVPGESGRFFGQRAFTWALMDSNPSHMTVGVSLPVAAIERAAQNDDISLDLSFPDEVRRLTGFDHFGIDWAHAGHDPLPFHQPHFDMHVYMISREDRATIDCTDLTAPAPERIPANYMVPPVALDSAGGTCVPGMGTHGFDLRSPELRENNPEPFTKNFILGFYGGRMIFLEPMATRELLMGRKTFSMEVPRPQLLGRSGWYPGLLVAHYDARFDVYHLTWSRFSKID